MPTGITSTVGTYEPGQEYLQYILERIAAWATASSTTSDINIEAANARALQTPTERDDFEPEAFVPAEDDLAPDIPTRLATADIVGDFDTEFERLTSDLILKGTQFIDTYFPQVLSLEPQVCAKLEAMLDGSQVVDHNAVWERTSSQANREQAGYEGMASAMCATNMSHTAGDLTAQIIHAGQQTAQMLGREQRSFAISTMLDNLSYALEQVNNWRKVAISAALDYISLYAQAGQQASQMATTLGVSQQPELISATARYRSALTGYESLRAQAHNLHNELVVKREDAMLQVSDTLREISLDSLMRQAQAYATEVSAVLGNIRANGGVDHQVR